MTEFHAEVIDIRDEGVTNGRRRFHLLLTETLFRGANGTLVAISVRGARLEVPVLGVVVEGLNEWYVVEKPLATGTAVTGYVSDSKSRDGQATPRCLLPM